MKNNMEETQNKEIKVKLIFYNLGAQTREVLLNYNDTIGKLKNIIICDFLPNLISNFINLYSITLINYYLF